MATINFSLAWVWLLIEGGSYSRAAFIYFRPILDVQSTKIVAQKTGLQRLHFKKSTYDRRRSFHAAVESQGCLLPWFAQNERACSAGDHDHTHLIEFAYAYGYYSRAATISFTELWVRLLFEGSYYSMCGYHSHIYGI